MSIMAYSDAGYLVMRIEKSIAGDVAMGNLGAIHHVWIHTSKAGLLGLTAGSHTYSFKVDSVKHAIFQVEVSSKQPKSVLKEADKYVFATVDANGWVVGHRTIAEAARIPAANLINPAA